MAIEIRLFEPQHAVDVQQLIVPIQQEEFGIDISLADQPDLQDIDGFYRQGLGNFWVAVVADEVVGTIALIDIGNRQVALRKMFVKEAYRGRVHGVAQALLDHVFTYTEEKGISQIFLGTTDKFVAAHRFYEKNDFDLIDVNALPASFPRMAVDTRFYVKDFS